MIVRLMGVGQFEVDERDLERLNELDDAIVAAIGAGDEGSFRAHLEELVRVVREEVGRPLPEDDLHPSDLMVPPDDLSLEEGRELFSGEGLIPDLPGR